MAFHPDICSFWLISFHKGYTPISSSKFARGSLNYHHRIATLQLLQGNAKIHLLIHLAYTLV